LLSDGEPFFIVDLFGREEDGREGCRTIDEGGKKICLGGFETGDGGDGIECWERQFVLGL
jgi:hypothetical protein